MNHLTEEQFEDILQGSLPEPEHISKCEHCKRILDEKRAVANRLRSAFTSLNPDENLIANIKEKIIKPANGAEQKKYKNHRILSFRMIAWQAAAAVIIIAVVLSIYVISPQPVMAAPAELVKIHQNNLLGLKNLQIR